MQAIPEYLTQLLDKAREKTGSDYATAKALGITRGYISQWRNGSSQCSPEDVAQLAEIAGLEADKWLIRAVIAKHEGTAKGDRLYKALGKALLVTGAVIGSNTASALQTFSTDFIRCILLLSRKPFSGRAVRWLNF